MIGQPGEHRTLQARCTRSSSGMFGTTPDQGVRDRQAAINIFAVGVMGIYLALHPALYREWLIALFPPIHRDLVRDVLTDLADSLRAYIVGQLLTMTFLGAITALGLFVLDVPFSLPFGIFTGLVAIVPFFGTLLSTTLPALFVLTGPGYPRVQPVRPRAARRRTRRRRAPDRGEHRLTARDVEEGRSAAGADDHVGARHRPAARPMGLIVALPVLVTLMVIVRRILITRIYEGQGFRRTTRERPLVLRLPVPGGGVLAPPGAQVDVVSPRRKPGPAELLVGRRDPPPLAVVMCKRLCQYRSLWGNIAG